MKGLNSGRGRRKVFVLFNFLRLIPDTLDNDDVNVFFVYTSI